MLRRLAWRCLSNRISISSSTFGVYLHSTLLYNTPNRILNIAVRLCSVLLPDDQLNAVVRGLQQLHRLLVRLTLDASPVDTQQLVAPFEPALAVRHPAGDDP